MIAGIFHEGSGLGDQLFRYITVRTLAEEKGFRWGMNTPENFKGVSFLKLDFGDSVRLTQSVTSTGSNEFFPFFDKKMSLPVKGIFEEKVTKEGDVDIRSYDPEINFVEDWSVIDGSFEDFKYWGHNLTNINEWLKVEQLEVPDTKCIIGFRGGEYAAVPELFLPEEYYKTAMRAIQHRAGTLNFEVHTDDPRLATQMFTRDDIKIIDNQQISHSMHSNMGFNWRSARFAKYAIIPNSAFFILPRLLKHHEDPTAVTIAPRYWAGRNVKQWRRPACYYPQFTYL